MSQIDKRKERITAIKKMGEVLSKSNFNYLKNLGVRLLFEELEKTYNHYIPEFEENLLNEPEKPKKTPPKKPIIKTKTEKLLKLDFDDNKIGGE